MAKTETAVKTETSAFNFAKPRTDIPLPVAAAKRSNPLAEHLSTLKVGESVGIIGKSKDDLASRVSRINNAPSNKTAKLDATGAPVFEKSKKPTGHDANALPIFGQVPVMVKKAHYRVEAVDPKTDPDNATCRIFRMA